MSIEKNLQEVGANLVIATEKIRGKKRFVNKAIKTAAFLVGATVLTLLPVQPVSADGAVVVKSSPVGISGIDNPCTPLVEALSFTGFLQRVRTPSGHSEFHTLLKSSDGSKVVEVFVGPSQDGNIRAKELLITPGGAIPNAVFDFEVNPEGQPVLVSLACRGS
ncbi:MAG: hypothetical protein Q8O68_00055 [Candidatus Daviesbacteria bacterium]|nr:hypothetical protein [Candidatus Daviesbacteria bacterium]